MPGKLLEEKVIQKLITFSLDFLSHVENPFRVGLRLFDWPRDAYADLVIGQGYSE